MPYGPPTSVGTLVLRRRAEPPPMMKGYERVGRSGLVVYSGGRPSSMVDVQRHGLGLLEFLAPVAGILSSIFGSNAAEDSEKRRIQADLRSQELQYGAAERMAEAGYKATVEASKIAVEGSKYAADAAARAAAIRAASDSRRWTLEADTARNSLQVQRAAMLDAQATQLIANTQNGIFGLANAGLSETGQSVRKWSSSAVVGVVALTGLVLLALNPPRFGKKKGIGEFFRRDVRRSEGASAPKDFSDAAAKPEAA